jgi:cyanophycin synthetase
MLAGLMQNERMHRTPKQVIYFSLSERNPVVAAHLEQGGTAFVANNDLILECLRNGRQVVGHVDAFACTAAGTARFQILNLLAAFAACRALGIAADSIAAALTDFGDGTQNRGRMNLYSVNGGYVVADYGHNIGAFQAICEMIAAWHASETIGVIALPGDRSDQSREQAAQAASCGFSRMIIREDNEKRGRVPGEVAEHFLRSVKAIHPAMDATIVVDEMEAYQVGLRQAGPGKVVVLFYDDYALLSSALNEFGAEPVRFQQQGLLQSHAERVQAVAS